MELKASRSEESIHVREQGLSLVEFDELNFGLNEQSAAENARRILENGKFTALNIDLYAVDVVQ